MKRSTVAATLMALIVSISCAHHSTTGDRQNARMPSGVDSDNDLTVWSLQDMAKRGDYDHLNRLFNSGMKIDKLPEGYAAGAAHVILSNIVFPPMRIVMDSMAGDHWHGKIYCKTNDPKSSYGFNRIRSSLVGFSNAIVPMAKFTTALVEPSGAAVNNVQGVTSNFVVLNYSQPVTSQNTVQERTLKNVIQVYDVMVAHQGKYGPVFIGKTWQGKYDRQGNFRANNPDQLLDWYFLDFNPEAVRDQKARPDWNGAAEVMIDYDPCNHT